jgi:hypothetical protein
MTDEKWAVLWTAQDGQKRLQEYAYGEDHARGAAGQVAGLSTWPMGEVVHSVDGGPWLPSPAPGRPMVPPCVAAAAGRDGGS